MWPDWARYENKTCAARVQQSRWRRNPPPPQKKRARTNGDGSEDDEDQDVAEGDVLEADAARVEERAGQAAEVDECQVFDARRRQQRQQHETGAAEAVQRRAQRHQFVLGQQLVHQRPIVALLTVDALSVRNRRVDFDATEHELRSSNEAHFDEIVVGVDQIAGGVNGERAERRDDQDGGAELARLLVRHGTAQQDRHQRRAERPIHQKCRAT